MALHGTIKDFSLAEILQLIGIQRKTGILTLENDADAVTVKFLEGKVVGADTKRRALEDLLGSVLVRTGRITEEQLAEALRTQRNTLQRLGHVLVRRQFINEEELIEALRVQTLQIVYRLFRWHEGDYHFRTAEQIEYDQKHFTPIDAETILMEGARMVDEWPIIERRVKSDKMILRKTEEGRKLDLPVQTIVDADIQIDFGFSDSSIANDHRTEAGAEPSLSAEEWEVLRLVDGASAVERICDRSTLGEFDTHRILADLMSRRLIEEVPRPTVVRSVSRRGGFLQGALRSALSGLVLLLAGVGASTLWANPFAPWRLGNQEETSAQLRRFATISRMERIEKAIEVFYLDTGAFPESLEPLARHHYLDPQQAVNAEGRPFLYRLSPQGFQLRGGGASPDSEEAPTVFRPFTPAERRWLEATPTGSRR